MDYSTQLGIFICNLENKEALREPVFKPLSIPETNEDVKEFNLSLKRIGIYARLYFYLINLFEISEDSHRIKNRIKVKVYDAELIRREVEAKVKGLTNDDIEILKFEKIELRMICAAVQSAYGGLRNECLKKLENEKSRELRLEKISAILDAEKVLFKDEPVWRDYYKQLTESHLERIINECNELGPH